MNWHIVSDSSCDLFQGDIACDDVAFSTIPFTISVGDKEYVDDDFLNVAEMLGDMEAFPEVSHTACPSIGHWMDAFKKAKHTIAITISGRLSGSQSCACAARNLALEEDPDKNILVLDSCATGPELAICIRRIRRWIQEGLSFESISRKAKQLLDDTHIVFALCSYDNLIKNGRMNKIVGFIARKLGMWGIGIGSPQGEIEIMGKTRGKLGALSMILDDMQHRGFQGGEVAISHCLNEALASLLKEKILKTWSTAQVTILPTRGLDSFYAERGGLIVAYSNCE